MNSQPSKRKRKYRAIQWTAFIGEFVSVATPFVIIGLVNYDKYFIQYDGTKMSIAFFMALAVMGFAIWCVSKKKLENSFITLVLGWAVIAFVFTMLGEMITDLAYIMWFGLIGLAGAFGLDEVSKYFKRKKDEITTAQKTAESDELVQEVKTEKTQKIKVKVRKDESTKQD